MRKIRAQSLSKAAFAKFGAYENMLSPECGCNGEKPCRFFRDGLAMPFFGDMAGFSTLEVTRQDKVIVTGAEYHNHSGEILMPMDDDAIVHVAPATNREPVPQLTEAFYVPKGTMLRLNTGVWHMAPQPVHNDVLHVLIVLPERLYANDCYNVDYEENDYIEIEF